MKALVLKIFICAMVILMPQIVNAEKTDWADNSYNFKSIKRIVLFDITSSANLNDVGRAAIYKIQSDYVERAQKKSNCAIITEEQAKKMLAVNSRDAIKQNIQAIADGWVQCNIKGWENDYYITPERTVWESKRMTRTGRNSDGSTWEEVYYVSVPVTYPPRRVDVSNLDVSFELYGVNTGRAVFIRDDVRSREDYDAQKDMFRRMCNSFFEDMGKKVK